METGISDGLQVMSKCPSQGCPAIRPLKLPRKIKEKSIRVNN